MSIYILKKTQRSIYREKQKKYYRNPQKLGSGKTTVCQGARNNVKSIERFDTVPLKNTIETNLFLNTAGRSNDIFFMRVIK
jgi:hypothetical protein